MKIYANAKINLTLDIVGKRDDGYHDLQTVMQSISLCDEIEINKNNSKRIYISCDKENIPCDERNIAFKAAAALFEKAGITDCGIDISIKKNIPSEAGMGGGSADAAAVLKALRYLFNIDISDKELYALSATIGADVPFCLHGGTCLCEGIGEHLYPLNSIPECSILICKPQVGVSTKEAYSAADRYPQLSVQNSRALALALNEGNVDLPFIAEVVYNHFDEVLHIPEVQIIKGIMNESGTTVSAMTGSGSAVFGIFEEKKDAELAAFRLRNHGEVYITEPCTEVNIIDDDE